MADTSPLFAPIRIGALELPGRLFKTATVETRASEDGFVTDELVEWYEHLARGGTPLVITGNLYVRADGKSTYRMCGVDSDDKIPGLARIAQVLHAHGGRLIAQLNHCGRQVIPAAADFEPVSASDVRDLAMGARPRALREDELPEVVESFARAAVRCQEAGFDGVQVHAAHGYLLNQFLTPHTNRRRDGYGGSFEARLRLLREVVQETRRGTRDDFALLLKLNGDDLLPGRRGLGIEEQVRIAVEMEAEGVDAVEVSVGHYESGFPMVAGRFDGFYRELLTRGAGQHLNLPRRLALRWLHPLFDRVSNRMWPARQGFNLDYARAFSRALRVPVVCVGGFHGREAMERAIQSGDTDAVSCGRAFIADPYLVEHLRTGTPGPVCDACNLCLARADTGPVDCWNPRVRAEKEELMAEKRAALEARVARRVS